MNMEVVQAALRRSRTAEKMIATVVAKTRKTLRKEARVKLLKRKKMMGLKRSSKRNDEDDT